jgi:hypothetical protein
MMPENNAADENWQVLLSLLPPDWERQAVLCRAVERLRGFESFSALLRVLLLHVGKGYSLAETSVRAKNAGLANVSGVAVLARLRQAENWFHQLCVTLAEESGWEIPFEAHGWNVRAVDSTLVKEPGRRGSQWRIHYSLQIPSLRCDHLELTSAKGTGTGERLGRAPALAGDLVLADRGYCKPQGIAALAREGAAVIVRLNSSSLPLFDERGKRYPLADHVKTIAEAGATREYKVLVHTGKEKIAGRLCVLRKSDRLTQAALRRIERKSQQGGPQPKPETLLYAGYVMVFTTLPEATFDTAAVLEWYRSRWQIELVFKRMKSLAGLGHLHKHDAASARAWLYGKLLIALLCQKLMRVGRDISPWGYRLPETWKWQRVAGL